MYWWHVLQTPWSCSISKCWRVVRLAPAGWNLVSRFAGGGGTSWHSMRVRTMWPRWVGEEMSGREYPIRIDAFPSRPGSRIIEDVYVTFVKVVPRLLALDRL